MSYIRQTARKSTGGVPRQLLASMGQRLQDQHIHESNDGNTDGDADSEGGQRNPVTRRSSGRVAARRGGAFVLHPPPPPALDPIPPDRIMDDRLTAAEVFRRLNGWIEVEDGSDTFFKEYIFKDFSQAWAFMSQVVVRVRLMNHHPDWHHVNHTVTVKFPSPFVDGLSSKDSNLAEFMEYIARTLNR